MAVRRRTRYNPAVPPPVTAYRWGKRVRAWVRRFALANPLCAHCAARGETTPGDEVDHIVPLAQGGTHDVANLQHLCRSCHIQKTRDEAYLRSAVARGRAIPCGHGVPLGTHCPECAAGVPDHMTPVDVPAWARQGRDGRDGG